MPTAAAEIVRGEGGNLSKPPSLLPLLHWTLLEPPAVHYPLSVCCGCLLLQSQLRASNSKMVAGTRFSAGLRSSLSVLSTLVEGGGECCCSPEEPTAAQLLMGCLF